MNALHPLDEYEQVFGPIPEPDRSWSPRKKTFVIVALATALWVLIALGVVLS